MRRKSQWMWIASASFACAMLVPGAATAAGVDPAVATDVQKTDAQKRYDRGRELLSAQDYQGALAEFRASFDIVASPNAHFSIARTLVSLGQLADAYVEFGATSAQARALAIKEKRYAQTADAAESEQRDLAANLAFVTITLQPPADDATVKLGDRGIDRDALGTPIPVMPGTTTIVVSRRGVEVVRQSLTLAASEKKSVVLEVRPLTQARVALEPEPETSEPAPVPEDHASRSKLRTPAYFAAGAGAVGLVTFAVFGSLEKSTYADLKDTCQGPCPPSRASDISKGRSQETIANVGLAVGLVGLAAGGVLFVMSIPPKTPAGAQAGLVVGPGFVGVRGSL